MKKSVCILLAAIICIAFCSAPAFAMPQEAQTIPVKISNFTNECEYIDLLIDIDEDNEYYTKENTENMRAQPFDTTELAAFDKDGFVSYTCHFKDARSDLRIKGGRVYVVKKDKAPLIISLKFSVMVAVLDRNGHILKVSDAVTISDDKCFLYDGSCVEYDYASGKVSADVYVDPDYSGLFKAFLLILSVVFILIVFLVVHSFISGLRKADDAQSSEETPKGFFKATVILTLLYIITAMLQGVALSKLYMPKNTMESVLLCCAELLPLIIAVVTAVRFKDFFKFIIPDVAFGVVSFQYGDIIMIILVFLFIVVQVFSMFLAVLISNHNQKKKRRKMREKPAR